MPNDFIRMTQGPAVLADSNSIEKDQLGFTSPNLHRRINTVHSLGDHECAPRDYELSVLGVDSYRITETFLHDEKSTNEIP